jgi:hypothetical protein
MGARPEPNSDKRVHRVVEAAAYFARAFGLPGRRFGIHFTRPLERRRTTQSTGSVRSTQPAATSASISWETASMSARWVKAWGKFPR